MYPNTLLPIFGVAALLLIVTSGFCMIVQATKLASRLFVIALCVVAAPFVLAAGLGNLHEVIRGAHPPIAAAWLFAALGVLALIALAWFALHLKGLHTFQRWLVPRFGPDVDGQVTGTYVVRLIDSAWGFMKFFVVVALILIVLAALR